MIPRERRHLLYFVTRDIEFHTYVLVVVRDQTNVQVNFPRVSGISKIIYCVFARYSAKVTEFSHDRTLKTVGQLCIVTASCIGVSLTTDREKVFYRK